MYCVFVRNKNNHTFNVSNPTGYIIKDQYVKKLKEDENDMYKRMHAWMSPCNRLRSVEPDM